MYRSILSKTMALALISTTYILPSMAFSATCSNDLSNIPITTLPYTISTNGSYCLKTETVSPSTSLSAITIAPQVTTVVLDLNSDSIGTISGDATDNMYFLFYDNSAGTPTTSLTMTVKNGAAAGFKKGIRLLANTSGTAQLTSSNLSLTTVGNGIDISGFDTGTLSDLNVSFAESSTETSSFFGLRVRNGGDFTLDDITVDMSDLTSVSNNNSDGIRIDGGSTAVISGARIYGSLLAEPTLYDIGILVFTDLNGEVQSNATISRSVINNVRNGINYYLSTGTYTHNAVLKKEGACFVEQEFNSSDVQGTANICK